MSDSSMKKTYVFDRESGKVVPKEEKARQHFHEVMGDLKEDFRSPVDGTMITSRSQWREHNRRNDVIDVGNDSSVMNPKRHVHRPNETQIVDDIKQAIHSARDDRGCDNHDWKF